MCSNVLWTRDPAWWKGQGGGDSAYQPTTTVFKDQGNRFNGWYEARQGEDG